MMHSLGRTRSRVAVAVVGLSAAVIGSFSSCRRMDPGPFQTAESIRDPIQKSRDDQLCAVVQHEFAEKEPSYGEVLNALRQVNFQDHDRVLTDLAIDLSFAPKGSHNLTRAHQIFDGWKENVGTRLPPKVDQFLHSNLAGTFTVVPNSETSRLFVGVDINEGLKSLSGFDYEIVGTVLKPDGTPGFEFVRKSDSVTRSETGRAEVSLGSIPVSPDQGRLVHLNFTFRISAMVDNKPQPPLDHTYIFEGPHHNASGEETWLPVDNNGNQAVLAEKLRVTMMERRDIQREAAASAVPPLHDIVGKPFQFDALKAFTLPLSNPNIKNAVQGALPKGEVYVLAFGALWCSPCQAEQKDVEGLFREYREKGLRVVTVERTESPEDSRIFSQWTPDFQHQYLRAQRGDIGVNLTMIPTAILVGRDGIVRWAGVGELPPADTINAELKK